MTKMLRYLFLLLVLLVPISACMTSQKIDDKRLYGIWIEKNETCKNNCGQIEFFSDGHFEAQNLPDSWFGYVRHYDIENRFDASGSWSLILPDSSKGFYKVDLFLKNVMAKEGLVSYHTSVYINPIMPNELYSWLGDESNRITFSKDGYIFTKTP